MTGQQDFSFCKFFQDGSFWDGLEIQRVQPGQQMAETQEVRANRRVGCRRYTAWGSSVVAGNSLVASAEDNGPGVEENGLKTAGSRYETRCLQPDFFSPMSLDFRRFARGWGWGWGWFGGFDS